MLSALSVHQKNNPTTSKKALTVFIKSLFLKEFVVFLARASGSPERGGLKAER